MALRKFVDFLRLSNIFFESTCTVPYNRKDFLQSKRSINVAIIFFVSTINLILNLFADFSYAVWAFQKEGRFIEAITAMSYVGFVVISDVKVFCIWWQRAILNNLMQKLSRRFPKTQQQQHEKEYHVEKYYKQCQWISIGFSILYMLLIIIYNFFVVFEYIIYQRWLGVRIVGRSLPYSQLIPWDYKDNWTYFVLYASEVLGGYTAAAQIIACDLLLCALSLQLIMHYNYISDSITAYQIQKTNDADNVGMAKDIQFVKNIVVYHTEILSLSEDLNVIFGLPLLLSFMISSCVICFLAFLMTVGVPAEVVLKLIVFLISCLCEVYIISHLGQQLNDASLSVFHSIFNQNWFHADAEYKKMLLIIGERAKISFHLKATQFIEITAETLTLIINMSYKLFALLRTIYGN